MSKEVQPKKTRSTKKVTDGSNTAELEAKIAELEAKLANLSSQVKPAEQKPAQTSPPPKPTPSGPTHGTLPAGMKPAEAPKPEPKPQPRPAASGPTHGTLPAGMKPAPKPEAAPEPTTSAHEPSAGEVAPAYSKISSTGYTGNKYFATRKRLSYHPADKQFTGSSTTTTSTTTTTTAPPAPEPEHESQTSTSRGTLPAGMKPQEKKSLWKAKGSDVAETYVAEEEHKAPPPQPRPAASGPTHGTLPAGMKPAEAPKPEPKPQPRPAASGPTHGTLPAGMKPAPKPEAAPEPTTSAHEPSAGEVAPAYSKISSTGYTGNKYFATRKRLSYHPADKQFTGSSTTTTTAPQPAAEPAKPKSTFRTTLPAGFKA